MAGYDSWRATIVVKNLKTGSTRRISAVVQAEPGSTEQQVADHSQAALLTRFFEERGVIERERVNWVILCHLGVRRVS